MLAVATSRPAVVARARASASSRARLASPARVLGPARAPARALAAIRGDLARARAAEEERTMSALDAVLGSSDEKEAAEVRRRSRANPRAASGVARASRALASRLSSACRHSCISRVATSPSVLFFFLRPSRLPQEPASPPPPARAPGGVSPEMKARLLNESVGLGGLPNKPMPANLFLNICVGVAAFAIVAKLGGALG
ncbi:uncharacterized protein MICPUCDRAFT_57893 [Micromonas pusilla CCMP1545]|uniref:Predicted protein n=1 Tax=Micromonas pusilla (strain CCMP1545) TaxID=564608 RepID=C1MT05_MICPC|nr:uncharacterized protein MICPUCDRAFT_57893 [Micromonas pusilla CCMP1545]EEH56866.1 predicted protein [Micromonas pusilla CCMP1545]|eukprot:XP_003058411.1 predicted protein [Micromonas pusilla CCMP1545]